MLTGRLQKIIVLIRLLLRCKDKTIFSSSLLQACKYVLRFMGFFNSLIILKSKTKLSFNFCHAITYWCNICFNFTEALTDARIFLTQCYYYHFKTCMQLGIRITSEPVVLDQVSSFFCCHYHNSVNVTGDHKWTN